MWRTVIISALNGIATTEVAASKASEPRSTKPCSPGEPGAWPTERSRGWWVSEGAEPCAVVLYESSSPAASYVPLYDESTVAVSTHSLEDARRNIEARAAAEAVIITNEARETITWSLRRIIAVAHCWNSGSRRFERYILDISETWPRTSYSNRSIVYALGKIGDIRARETLLQVLDDSYEKSKIRGAAAESLGSPAHRESVPSSNL
jgi:Domain of unknown function (DUF4288)/PBS lyase HEAT-like repeat